MKLSFRILSVVLILCMIFGFAVNAENEYTAIESADSPTLISQNEKLQLFLNHENGNITITDKNSNVSYYSNPKDADNLKGPSRTAAESQLILSFIDKQGNTTVINSRVESVNKNGFKASSNGNTLKCIYKFPNYKTSITLYYTLTDDRLSVKIPVKEILTDKKEPYLSEIRVLPYFGAASSDNGFILVPDGCGSIINFGGKKSPSYSQELYGVDRGKTAKNVGITYQPALVPAIGLSYGSYEGKANGLLIYAESGDALATAYASAKTDDGFYNTAGFGFTYRANDTVTMMDQTSKSEKVIMSERTPVNCKEFEVSFTPLTPEKNSIVDFANAARKRIFDGFEFKKLENTSLPVYIKNYISVRKTKYFLGIPYKGNQSLTNIKDLFEMLENFGETPVVMSLLGLDKYGAVGGKIDNKFDISALEGGYSKFGKLIEKAQQSGGAVYPMAEFVEFSNGNGANRVKSIANLTLKHYFHNYGTLEENKAYAPLYILKSSAISKNVKSWIKSAKKREIQFCAPISLSNQPYRSSTGINGDRESTKCEFVNMFKLLEKNDFSILTESTAAYAMPYSDNLQSLPVSSSGFSATDSEVPFLQMILHGIKSYSIPPINLSGDIDRYFLKCIETGSSLCFAFSCSDYSYLADSPLDYLSGAEYSHWKNRSVEMAKKLGKIMGGTVNSYITDYQIISDDVRIVTYENGSKFIINYGDKAADVNGYKVESMSYTGMGSEV